jgi:hypothetical protein
VLPKGLRSIGNSSFAQTGLKSIEFGDLVTFVYSRVFEGSSELRNLSIGGNIELFEGDALSGSSISRIYIREEGIEEVICPVLGNVGLLDEKKGVIVVDADFRNKSVCVRVPVKLDSRPGNEYFVIVAGLAVFGVSVIVVVLSLR